MIEFSSTMIRTTLLLVGSLLFQTALGQGASQAPLLQGLKIAFVSYRTGTAEVYLMKSDGSDVEQITDSPENNSFPYQIDQRTIGFTRMDSLRNSTSFQIDIFTKEERPLDTEPIRQCAKWEVPGPDSTYYAFIRSTDYRDRELFTFNTVTGREKQITSREEADFKAYSINHSWSPDGKRLAFMSGPNWFNQFIRMYDVDGDSVYAVTDRGYMNSGLKWLRDGETLIANLKVRDENLYEIYRVDINSGTLKALTTGINLHPDVSPDGEWIVFESQRHGNDGEVYVMRKDGSEQVRLTRGQSYSGRAVWFRE